MVENRRRVVVTGLGAVSPLGCDVRTNWENILAGKSGVGPLTRFPGEDQRCRIAGEVKILILTLILTRKSRPALIFTVTTPLVPPVKRSVRQVSLKGTRLTLAGLVF